MPARKAIKRIPLELWLNIFSFLPEISTRKLSVTLHRLLPTTDVDLKHSKAWDIIFDDYKFLDWMTERGYPCILLGSGLHLLYTVSRWSLAPVEDICLVLLRGNYEGGLAYARRDIISEFARSARKEVRERIHVDDYTFKVPETFRFRCQLCIGSHQRWVNITLNIANLFLWNAPIQLKAPQNLVSLKGYYLYSAYLYWKGDGKFLRVIKPRDIVGKGRYASVCGTKDSVKYACGLTIQQPIEHRSLGRCYEHFPWQVKLENIDGSNFEYREKFELANTERKHCLGWEHKWSERLREVQWRRDPVMENRIVLLD
jgi:hypothetical protein